MKSILILSLIGCALVCLVQTEPFVKAPTYSINKLNLYFESFKLQYGKIYKNQTDQDKRKSIFATNLQKINDHNEKYNTGKSTYTLGATVFADWHPDEFAAYVKKGLSTKPNMSNVKISQLPRQSAPASIDWRNYNGRNYVQAIKNQGRCGSCWSFASVSAMESYAALLNGGNVPNLSEQNLVDCVYSSNGCLGGNNLNAWSYVFRNGGIATAATYPYVSGGSGTWNGRCRYSSSMNAGVRVTNLWQVNGGDTSLTRALGTIGPITAYVYASTASFQFYKSGVFSDVACQGRAVDHAVNLVGYGSLNGSPYYILRNSWGSGWGMGGYMFIARGSNMCSVASFNYFPSVSVNRG